MHSFVNDEEGVIDLRSADNDFSDAEFQIHDMELEQSKNADVNVRVVDILGNNVDCTIDYNNQLIRFNNISNGTYFLILNDQNKKIVKQFIVIL